MLLLPSDLRTESDQRSWLSAPLRPEVALVVTDMDGTFLDDEGLWPVGFERSLQSMLNKEIWFAPASANQVESVARYFPADYPNISFIAENGALVVHQGKVLSERTLDQSTVLEVISLVRELAFLPVDLVVCHRDRAFIESVRPDFVSQCAHYIKNLEIVSDLASAAESVLRLSIFCPPGAREFVRQHLSSFASTHHVTPSAQDWVEITAKGAHKGTAVRMLQEHLGITREQTVAFGNFDNDNEMFVEAERSFAMENASLPAKQAARYVCPPNSASGLTAVLQRLIG